MKRRLVPIMVTLGIMTLAAVACGQPAPTPTPTPTQTPKPTMTTPPQPPTTTTPAPKPTTSPTPTVTASPVALTLAITEPVNESVLGVSNVTIKGKTVSDAVVSINGDLVEVDASGNFYLPVVLEGGPNVFDITATDEDGNEVTNELVVSYAP